MGAAIPFVVDGVTDRCVKSERNESENAIIGRDGFSMRNHLFR